VHTISFAPQWRQNKQKVDRPNPNAPAELSRFAFLISRWRFDAKFKSANEEWQAFHGAWLGHYILDGYAIADEYRMIGSSGEKTGLRGDCGFVKRVSKAGHGDDRVWKAWTFTGVATNSSCLG